MWETLIDAQHGLPTLIASLVVVLGLNFLFKVLEFVWNILKKKNELSEKSVEKLTAAVELNTKAIDKLDGRVGDTEKFRLDLHRSFTAIKYLSGDKWKEVRAVMMGDDDLP